MRLYLIYSL
uniref:Uncharacterized protein n=1 Tax=Arundo donax TaxID=35708 RepID=A0A0A8YGG8_ARUDO